MTTSVVAFVIPSLCESPVSVAAESANDVGAGVDGGTVVVVVVGATVVVVGATVVVVGAIVVVGAGAVVVGAIVDVVITAVVEVVAMGIHTAPGTDEAGATEATTGTGGVYPQPDS